MLMDHLGKSVSEYPKIAIGIIILITLAAIGSMFFFGLDQEFSEESFLPDLEIAEASNEIADEYTSTSTVSILVKSKQKDILTSNGLAEMLLIEKGIINDSQVISTLETPEIPSINVNSVADVIAQTALSYENITFPTMDQKLFAIQFMSDDDIKALVVQLLSSNETPPQLKGMFSLLLTKDFNPTTDHIKAKGTMIIINMNASRELRTGHGSDDSEIAKSEKRIDKIVRDTDLKSTEMRVMGQNIIMNEIMDANNQSMAILLPLAFGAVIIILAIIYRNGLDMLFSLLALVFAIIWVYGFGAALGYTFNPITTAVPVLIVGLGIDYGIHITMRYREETRKEKGIKESINITIQSVGMALLLATVTTVIAFLSNLISPISLLSEFGVLCAIGIIGSFVTMTTFVPACKQLNDLRKLKKNKAQEKNEKKKNKKSNNKTGRMKSAGVVILDKTMSSGAVAAEQHPIGVIIVVTLITIGSGWLVLQLETTFNFEDFLPEDLEITKDIEYMLNEFEVPGGAGEKVNILVKGDLTDPELLSAIHETTGNLNDTKTVIKHEGVPEVGSILVLMQDWATNSTAIDPYDKYDTDFEMLYNKTFTIYGSPRSNASSQNIKLIYDWLFLNPNSMKDVKGFLHRNKDNEYDGSVIRISINVDSTDDAAVDKLYNDLKEDKEPLNDAADKSIITSGPILTKVIMDLLNESQLRTLIITIFISLIVLTIVFWYKWRSFILGLITITPVIFCVLWTLGTMFLLDIPLNVMTITIASLTVGLGITYGIHVTHRFLEDLERQDSIDAACRSTVTHTGTALFGAAATTIAGFGLLVFALMPPLQQFGGITALTILFSFLASVFVLPTFLVLWARYRKKKGNLHNHHNHNKKITKQE